MSRQPCAAWHRPPIQQWLGVAALIGCLLTSPATLAATSIASRPLLVPGISTPGTPSSALSHRDQQIAGCIEAAASTWRISPIVIVILLHVEGGSLGAVHPNANGTVDIGPMQVNQIWLPTLARRWHTTVSQTYADLEDNFCANVAGGTWILHRAIEEAHGHLWRGVAYYHSHTKIFESAYLRAVLGEVRHLRAEMQAHAGGAS